MQETDFKVILTQEKRVYFLSEGELKHLSPSYLLIKRCQNKRNLSYVGVQGNEETSFSSTRGGYGSFLLTS